MRQSLEVLLSKEQYKMLQVVIRPTANSSRQAEMHRMDTKNTTDTLSIKIAVRMDKPQNMKHCG